MLLNEWDINNEQGCCLHYHLHDSSCSQALPPSEINFVPLKQVSSSILEFVFWANMWIKRLTRNPRVLFLERGRLNVFRPGWKLLGSNLFTSILFSIWIGKSLLCMQPWICLGLTKHSTPYPSVWHFIFNYSKFHPCVSLIEKTVAKLRICESIFQQAIYVLDMSTFEPFSQ